MSYSTVAIAACLAVVCLAAADEGPVGKRPYEMQWAGRTEDDRPALLDFEDLAAWTVETHNSVASLTRSRERPLWGRYVGKLAYRGTGDGPRVTIRPPKPIRIDAAFDCVNFWVHGNNSPWFRFPDTPQVDLYVVLRGADGKEVRVSMGKVRWYEWWVMHRRLSPTMAQGAALVALEIAGGTNKEDRLLFFDNLSVYEEQLAPLTFEPRPKRGVDPFPGQSPGLNTGPGRLPFPTREETILPDNLTREFETTLERDGEGFVFRYRGADGTLAYRYTPASGTLSDVTARWEGRGESLRPLVDGGTHPPDGESPDAGAERLSCERVGDTIVSRWRIAPGRREVTYTFRLWQKSLVVDVACPGGRAGGFRIGRVEGVEDPRLVTLPYLTFRGSQPAVVVAGPAEEPLFVTALLDWYRSNASTLYASNDISDRGATCNGGATYGRKTDGRRNDCFERLFLTVSPRFEEVLPNIPNPKSPWMEVMGERVWAVQAASADREADYQRWVKCARHGITKVILCDHEPGWRDGGESFTLRTRAAPGKGGDEGQAEFSRKVQALGFRYGLYNNYTDFAPVNEHWNEDYVARLPDGEWRRAWARCYNLKPARAVELEAKLAPVIQKKFNLSTAYCDVHSIVRPWDYLDYDARVPGAGCFASTYYAYGEIMLSQKKTWNGPVYSEGGMHWLYAGLTDGNYAQDGGLPHRPWLVDFDLRKIHPLSCNFGMGKPNMFNGRVTGPPERQHHLLDEFLTATIAFGHTGYLEYEAGLDNAFRSYYRIQALAAQYATATVDRIRYANEKGELLDTSAAVATGAYKRRQIEVRYSNGLVTAVNGNPTDNWECSLAGVHRELPPFGYAAVHPALVVLSGLVDGRRVDYVEAPAYWYGDGRGRFAKLGKVAADGPMVVLPRAAGQYEVIPLKSCREFGVRAGPASHDAIALDEAGKEVGPAETRLSRGFTYIVPRKGAFSYVLKPSQGRTVVLACAREKVVAGETVVVKGGGQHELRIPRDAEPGDRVWRQFEDGWIDFTGVPLMTTRLTLRDGLRLELTSNLGREAEAKVVLAGREQTVSLAPGRRTEVTFPLDRPDAEGTTPLPLRLSMGDHSYEQTWQLKAVSQFPAVVAIPEHHATGQRIRGGKEGRLHGSSGAMVREQTLSCGGRKRQGFFIHPPWRDGVGYALARLGPISLPAGRPGMFRCAIGKGDGSDPGDGILFRVVLIDENGKESLLVEKQWGKHAWTDIEADLAPWAGKQVRIKLVADVGPNDNSIGDWACWADVRIEGRKETLVLSIRDGPAP